MVAGGWGRRTGELTGTELQFCKMRKVLEMGGGDGSKK